MATMVSTCIPRKVHNLSTMYTLLATAWLLVASEYAGAMAVSTDSVTMPPNIIFIVADDLGWNDVSFHGSDQIPTPNIDALAFHGVILNSHYVQPVCTPSRSALMTGKYPIRTGMQGQPISPAQLRALPEGKILPQYLKDLGYVTRAVGKWHLGHHSKKYTPTYRGFDSHLGYWSGLVGYYDFIIQSGNMSGYDMRDNMRTAWEYSGRYVTDVFTEEAERLIAEHDPQRPLFLYLAHLGCHAGEAAKWLDAPQRVVNAFGHVSDPNRRIYAAVMSKVDESVGRVAAALQQRGMLENSIIVFIADNGAPSSGQYNNWGSNYPLRGIKNTLWEGGVRGVAAVWSPLLENTPRVSNQLMHITDWLPTLYAAAGGNASSLPEDLDGVNAWPQLVTGFGSPRSELLINVDEVVGNAAIRLDDWKLVRGRQNSASDTGYQGSTGREDAGYTPVYTPEQVLSSATGRAISSALGNSTPAEVMLRLRAEATVSCPDRPQQPRCAVVNGSDVCVFNVSRDPCEAGDGAASEAVLSMLLERLEALSQPMLPQQDSTTYPGLADPRRWNNTWVPWTDCLANATDEACNAVANTTMSVV
ncbi:arylsulfatase B-like isoform X1 [Schistocerca gregaria]|uniref:arylsulfatase B-like isoform X1 n=2 Tax=Schistocerca gregaria TaxID=7010 RepID=UPI00211E7145|nr:arylsulfatase B-like isoform X1 [Schistocerca gregaria]